MDYKILIVDDDRDNLSATRFLLEDEGYQVDGVSCGEEAIERVKSGNSSYALVILDYHLPKMSGRDTLKELRELNPNLYILVYSGDTSSREPVKETLRGGAIDFIEKSEDPKYLLSIIRQWCQKYDETTRPLVAPISMTENENLMQQLGIIGRSQVLADICRMIKKYDVEQSSAGVLILGETGTGKEVFARAVHLNSPQRNGPFVAVNCGAISENLIETELFGHEKGAFTSASNRKVGKFENANNGTIFLDELGEASLATQVRLLRVLQERVVTPVGSNREIKVNVRIIAATNRNLENSVREGLFREDLYYRLNVISFSLPPLRERREDIAPLLFFFCERFNKQNNTKKQFLMKTVRILENYSWPGNVRELENQVIKLLTNSAQDTVGPEDLDAKFFDAPSLAVLTLPALISRQEQEKLKLISNTLNTSKSMRDAAKRMLLKSTLHNMLKKFGLVRPAIQEM